MAVRFVLDGAAMAQILRGPDGPVVRHLIRVGDATIAGARRRINNRSGRLSASLVKRITNGPNGPGVTVIAGAGLNPSYAYWVHEGNGPPGTRIYPKGGVLAFTVGGTKVFARSVKVIENPNPYLRDALAEAMAAGVV